MAGGDSEQHRTIVGVAFAAIEKLGVPIAVLAAMLGWFMANEAGWIDSKSKRAVEMLAVQQQQVGALTTAITGLATSVAALNDAQRARERDQERALRQKDQDVREMWCYAFVKDPAVLKLCTAKPTDGRP